jgi:sugar phosphate isomerase/epimerase
MKFSNLEWSFSTLGCPLASLEETIAIAKQFGIKTLELRTLKDRVDLPEFFTETYGAPERLSAYLKAEQMQIASLDSSLKLIGCTEKDKAAFMSFVPWAEALGVPYIRVFDGGHYGQELSADDLDALIATTRWWDNLRIQNGWKVDILIETHDCLTATPACLAYEEAAGRIIPILWDTHHTWKKGKEPCRETWKALQPFVRHIHIKDSISVPSARHPFTYVQLGTGEFDMADVLSFLSEDNYSYAVSLEWEKKWHPYLPELPEALQQARNYDWL